MTKNNFIFIYQEKFCDRIRDIVAEQGIEREVALSIIREMGVECKEANGDG